MGRGQAPVPSKMSGIKHETKVPTQRWQGTLCRGAGYCTTRNDVNPAKVTAWYRKYATKYAYFPGCLACIGIADLRIADATGDATEHELHLGMRS